MSLPVPPFPDDYEAIADAVMETARGRWFLAEYARRNRAAETGAAQRPAPAGASRRPGRPACWRSLSEAEKAILFA
ncbi:MAG TPA: hypothetical protein VGC51_12860 [Hansschlegelia sp.]